MVSTGLSLRDEFPELNDIQWRRLLGVVLLALPGGEEAITKLFNIGGE